MKRFLLWLLGIFGLIIFLGIIGSYSPSNTEMLAETPEQSAMDEEKPVSRMGVADCLSNSGGVVTPDKQHLYSLNEMVVFQTVPDGVLIQLGPNLDNPRPVLEDIAFLKTDRDFADGAMLNGYLAAYRGTYEYSTKSGLNKKVLAFKLHTGSSPHRTE